VTSPRPATVVEELRREVGSRLHDMSLPMSRNELRRALTELRRAQSDAQAEEFGALFTMIGMVYVRLDDPKSAIEAFRNAAHHEPTVADHPGHVASVLLRLTQFQPALDALRDARTKPHKHPGFEFVAWINTAEAYYGLGDGLAARLAFEEGVRHADPASHSDMFKLAHQAAIIDADDDAVEFFARYVTLAQGLERGELPAVEVIRQAPEELKVRLADLPPLAAAIERATARWDAPTPDEHQVAAEIQLDLDAWTKVMELVEHPPAPSETLRRLCHAARA